MRVCCLQLMAFRDDTPHILNDSLLDGNEVVDDDQGILIVKSILLSDLFPVGLVL